MRRLESPETFSRKEEKSKERKEQPLVPGPSLQASETQPVPERKAELPIRVHGVNRLQGAGRGRQGQVSALSFPVCMSFGWRVVVSDPSFPVRSVPRQ